MKIHSTQRSELGTQYTVLSNDMRFYADQRFKIVTVFLIVSGVFATVAKDQASVLLGAAGVGLAYICFCWEVGTTRWWGTLITRCQEIETAHLSQNAMIRGYLTYREQNPPKGFERLALLRPSVAVSLVYLFGAIGWGAYALVSWPHILAKPWVPPRG